MTRSRFITMTINSVPWRLYVTGGGDVPPLSIDGRALRRRQQGRRRRG